MTASHQYPVTLPNSLAWADRAACRGDNLELFFTESKTGVELAKSICGTCPVREACLAETLQAEDGSRYGVYGGLTPAERAELVGEERKERRRRADVARCGTLAAYRRHSRNGEPPCALCSQASAEDQRERAKKRKRGQADRRLRTTGTTKASV
ncbi:WhiB family transcriptional regulator [Streptomyces olivaceus]|uniref:WhiB family transcriptional regulator n=1 Tax=Streptomyces olivaceus TaxID=47716 RepID=UPI0022EE523F|nr:WhiB family transcriptional regulator [Streptomyces olivaceus]GHI91313.1 hypothetical protein TPA0905_07840 [Streptomyces olivaceus]